MARNDEQRESSPLASNSSSQVPLLDYGGDGVDYSEMFNTNVIFTTFEEAYEWAKIVALKIGFQLMTSLYKALRDGRPVHYLRCNRGLRSMTKDRDLDAAVRKNTKTKSCKCPFVIKTILRAQRDGWEIVVRSGIYGMHNHSFIVYREGHRGINGLSPNAKLLVRELNDAQCKPAQIMVAVRNKFPEESPNIRHIYNFKEKLRRESFEGRDVVHQFLHLANDLKYINWIATDPGSGAITHAFVVHPTMAKMLRTYPYVILLDSTYRTNRHNMPFLEVVGVTPTNQNFLIGYALMKDEIAESYQWVLKKLKLLIGFEVSPKAIVTDRELGLMKQVKEVFPEYRHLLCTWHINKDVEAKVTILTGKNFELGARFKNRKWNKILNAMTVEEYNNAVSNMKDTWSRWPAVNGYVERTWLNEHKEKFVRAWTNDVLHFGNTTTCRVESAHSVLKKWLGTFNGSLDSIFKRVHCQMENQIVEIRNKLEDSRRRHGGLIALPPFQYLNGHTSHHALDILSGDLKRMRELGSDVYERCGCALVTTHGLPCACTQGT